MSTFANFCFQDEQARAGYIDGRCAEEVLKFGPASRNTLVIERPYYRGGFNSTKVFWEDLDMIRDRNPSLAGGNSVPECSVTDAKITKTKIFWNTCCLTHNIDGWKKITDRCGAGGCDNGDAVLSQFIARNMGIKMENYFFKKIVGSLGAAMSTVPEVNIDGADAGGNANQPIKFSTSLINAARQRLGSCASKIVAILGPSSVWYQLVDDQINTVGTDCFCGVVQNGVPQTMGLPYIAIDDPNPFLVDPNDPSQGCYVYFLTQAAGVLEEAECPEMATDLDVCEENMIRRFKAEGAAFISLKGFSWQGGNHPLDAELFNPVNWQYAWQDFQNGPGVRALVCCDFAGSLELCPPAPPLP